MFQPDKLADLIAKRVLEESAPFTLEALIAWLETRDPNEKYDYWSCARCLLGQYGFFAGMKPESFKDASAYYCAVQNKFTCKYITLLQIVQYEPTTFGAALNRARAAHNEVR